jgi:hypothetical protein
VSRVFKLFNIRPGEERATVLMLLHAFFMGIATTFLEISASALFLARFDATRIPFVYLGAAVASTLIGAAYAVLRRRVPFWRLMKSTLLFLFLVMAGLRLGLSVSETGWLLFGLFIWYRVVSSLTDLEFWAVAARLYDVREGVQVSRGSGSERAVYDDPCVGVEPRVLSASAAGSAGRDKIGGVRHAVKSFEGASVGVRSGAQYGDEADAGRTQAAEGIECRQFLAPEIGRIHFRFRKKWRHNQEIAKAAASP